MTSGILAPAPRSGEYENIGYYKKPDTLMNQDLLVRVIVGPPGLLAFHFVDVPQLTMLKNEMDLPIFADGGQSIIDLFDLLDAQLLELLIGNRHGRRPTWIVVCGHALPPVRGWFLWFQVYQ